MNAPSATTTRSTPAAGPSSAPPPGPLAGAVAAEWTKLWSVRSTWWTMLSAVLLTAATAGQLAIYAANANTDDDPGVVTVGSIVIDSLELTQYVVLALGLLAVTVEFGTGTLRTTLRCTPSRGRVLLAKAVVIAAVTFVLGLVLGGVGVLVAAPVLGEGGAAPLGGTLRDVTASAAYLALVGVLALGLGAVLRSPVLTLIVLLAGLMIVPLSLQEPGIAVLTRIADGFPGVAGGHFLAGDTGPYPPVVGLLLLAAWAAAALAAGRAALRHRDA
ncbi:ABC transporter permease [Micromonospora sp. RTGN7]|uniref:ABC transporter permease n=1 Tax=Micromonospora sp. RTGN7 TaxID=3016526 RepID=UPI0029FF0FE6|nr:ABC transporter permease [Micromonospora sp. RTGN7]